MDEGQYIIQTPRMSSQTFMARQSYTLLGYHNSITQNFYTVKYFLHLRKDFVTFMPNKP